MISTIRPPRCRFLTAVREKGVAVDGINEHLRRFAQSRARNHSHGIVARQRDARGEKFAGLDLRRRVGHADDNFGFTDGQFGMHVEHHAVKHAV